MLARFLLPSLPDPETMIDCSLLWARLQIQGNSNWTLEVTGSVCTIVSTRLYQMPHSPPPPRAPSLEERLISRNNLALALLEKGAITFGVNGRA